MDPKELKKLVKTLKSLGVTSYDDGKGIKLTITEASTTQTPRKTRKSKEVKEIEHKVEELTSLMKMSDMDLVDRLFPDHQLMDEEV